MHLLLWQRSGFGIPFKHKTYFHIRFTSGRYHPTTIYTIEPGKIHQILCTGNLCSRETFDYLRNVCDDVITVRGDYDDASPSYSSPVSRVIVIGAIRIGLIHGHTIIPWGDRKSLSAVARKMDVDVLILGHTHVFEAWESEGRFFVNPGSATGAYTSFGEVGKVKIVEAPTPAVTANASAAAAIAADGSAGSSEVNASATTEENGEGTEEGQMDGADASTAATVSDAPGTATEEIKSIIAATIAASSSTTTTQTVKVVGEPTPSFVLLDVQGAVVVVVSFMANVTRDSNEVIAFIHRCFLLHVDFTVRLQIN
jgi:vacuolar protein sorting-associated protein 29